MTTTVAQKELALILSGVLIGIAIGQFLTEAQAERSRLSSRVFTLEQELRAERAHRTGEHAVPVRVVATEGAPS